MKIFFVFYVLLFLLTGFQGATAQEVFAPVGAEWWYYNRRTFDSYWETEILYKNQVTRDTVVMGKDCRIINQTAYARTRFPPSVHYDTNNLRELYIYDNVDTVFLFNENFNAFTPLYVFNVKEGDTVCLPVIPDILENEVDLRTHPLTGDRSFCFVVDSIRSKKYDTSVLKTYFNHFITGGRPLSEVPVYNWSNYYIDEALAGAYAEKIGGISGGLIPVAIGEWVERPSSLAIMDLTNNKLRCYADEDISLKLITGTCDSLAEIPVKIASKVLSNTVYLYPNPAKSTITLSGLENFTGSISIIDLNGKIVRKKAVELSVKEVDVDIRHITPGIYFLNVNTENGAVYRKLLIQ